MSYIILEFKSLSVQTKIANLPIDSIRLFIKNWLDMKGIYYDEFY